MSAKTPCQGKGQRVQLGPALRRLSVLCEILMSCSQQESSDTSKEKDTWTQPDCKASVWSLPAEQQLLHLLHCWGQCHPAGACLLLSWQDSSFMACVSARVMCGGRSMCPNVQPFISKAAGHWSSEVCGSFGLLFTAGYNHLPPGWHSNLLVTCATRVVCTSRSFHGFGP